jgi:hypothetical protein
MARQAHRSRRIAYRAELGRDILTWLDNVATMPGEGKLLWWFRDMPSPDKPFLVFGTATRHDAEVGERFTSFIELRHQQFIEMMPERADVLTVGVLLTPRHDGRRP